MMQADGEAPPTAAQPPSQLLPYPLFDAVLDLPHPGASRPGGIDLYYPPSNVGSGIVDLLPPDTLAAEFGPETTPAQPTAAPSQGVAKIARFTFPEFNDQTNAQEAARRSAHLQRTGGLETSPCYNRHDLYLEQAYDVENGQQLPSYHVFSHRLSDDDGTTVHGHVRRYLSSVERSSTGRSDVGRRSVRALVVLTRNSGGGDRLYNAMLKTMEVLRRMKGEEEDVRWFLHSMFREHVNLCRDVVASSSTGGRTSTTLSKPHIITLPLIEAGRGKGLFGNVDNIKFACPPSFLHEREPTNVCVDYSRNDMMPMLRCLGVTRTMRLLSALISEKRVIFTSAHVPKLSAVGYGAVAMMGQGMLPPPSVFVPVLPPGLASLLSTPSAYVIGVLKGSTSNFIDLRSTVPNLGELVIFDLDSIGNEPFFVGMTNPVVAVPDLTRRSFEDVGDSSLNGMSLPDMLYQDLSEVIKADKKQMFWQGAVQEKLGMAAEKGRAAAKNAFKKGLKYLKDKKSSMDVKEANEEEDEEEAAEKSSANSLTKLVGKGNYFYEQGFPNEAAEGEARVAFATFFVCLFGDLRVYLTQTSPGTTPVADRDKFMKFRANNGDLPGSAMYNLLNNFLRSNLFDQFVNARLQELQLRRAVPEDAPLFALTANYHRSNKIEFLANNIRQSVRQVAMNPNMPGKYLISWNEGIRRRVLDLTSTQAFNGDPRRALALLTEDCHESTSILIDTIMILWTRIQEGKGMQWKKALLALQIFRDLLLNGPISTLAEAIDGFASIRIMKSYTEAMRGQNSALVRAAATEVYNLIVNTPVLFAMRREALNRQRIIKDPKPSPLRKETRMIKGISQFRNVHIALRPAGAVVAPAPPAPSQQPVVNDLLGSVAPSNNAPIPTQAANYSSDLLSLGAEETPHEAKQEPNPFYMAIMNQSMPPVNPAQQLSQPQMQQPSTPFSTAGNSQPQPNQSTPRESPPVFAQPTQQPMHQQQPHPVPIQQGIQSPFVSSNSVQPLQTNQHQANLQNPHQAMMQNATPPMYTSPQHNQQGIMPPHPNQIQWQQPNQPMQQQWSGVQQPMPPAFHNGMPPQVGFNNIIQQQQGLQGFHQPQQQPPQQQQQQSKPNYSMFDPMAK